MRPLKAKGFTLVEILVALFVFVILMAAASQIFVASFSGYRDARMVHIDLQNAQYTLNSMAKMIRTSTLVSPASANTSRLRFFDYSQGRDGLCVEFNIAGNMLSAASVETGNPEECGEAGFTSEDFISLTSGFVSGKFAVTPSESGVPKKVGRVTVSLRITEGGKHTAFIQSSTSLRDYGNIDW